MLLNQEISKLSCLHEQDEQLLENISSLEKLEKSLSSLNHQMGLGFSDIYESMTQHISESVHSVVLDNVTVKSTGKL